MFPNDTLGYSLVVWVITLKKTLEMKYTVWSKTLKLIYISNKNIYSEVVPQVKIKSHIE